MKRTLTLKREHLAELSAGELASVAGAQAQPPTLQVKDCLLGTLSCPEMTCYCCTASSSC